MKKKNIGIFLISSPVFHWCEFIRLIFHCYAILRISSGWSIVLIGKVGEGDPWTDISLLNGLPNLYLMGPRSYEQLPSDYLKGFDVAFPHLLANIYEKNVPDEIFYSLVNTCYWRRVPYILNFNRGLDNLS